MPSTSTKEPRGVEITSSHILHGMSNMDSIFIFISNHNQRLTLFVSSFCRSRESSPLLRLLTTQLKATLGNFHSWRLSIRLFDGFYLCGRETVPLR